MLVRASQRIHSQLRRRHIRYGHDSWAGEMNTLDGNPLPSLYHPYGCYRDGKNGGQLHQLRPKPSDSEKITINLGYVDLGHIDLMVQDGFYCQPD